MRSVKWLALLFFVFPTGSSVHAANSLGFDVTGGVGTSGMDANGSLDLKPADVKNPYEASLSYAHLYTTVGTESRTNQYTAGVSHTVDNHWDGHGEVTYWKDNINDIHYAGPTLGVTYTWLTGAGIQSASPLTQDDDVPSDKNETFTEPPPGDELAAVSLNADLFFYGTEVEASSATRRVFDPKLNRFITKVIPPSSHTERVMQFHPNVTIEKPLFDSTATPYLTAGHYFYSRNPGDIEALAGRPRFAASANQLNGLVGGFLNNNGEIGVRVALPIEVDSDFRLG